MAGAQAEPGAARGTVGAAWRRRALLQACALDVAVRKAGNVSVHSAGHGMQARQFIDSAQAAAAALCQAGAPVGWRIEQAVQASWQAAGCNTNLGIVLLAAPLLAAAERCSPTADPATLQAALRAVLQGLQAADAQAVFRAIAHANPGGLGRHDSADVRQPPTIGLLAAMALAAPRDQLAWQYVHGFDGLFLLGLPALAGQRRGAADARAAEATHSAPGPAPGPAPADPAADPPADPLAEAVLRVYLAFLASGPDSHIVRKHGLALAQTVPAVAQRFAARAARGEALHDDPDWIAWDASLKQQGLNPGTCADLTVATLLLAGLLGRLPAAGARTAAAMGDSFTSAWHGT